MSSPVAWELNAMGVVDAYQIGYDAWLTALVERGRRPLGDECPGLLLPLGSDERKEFMRGWLAARDDE